MTSTASDASMRAPLPLQSTSFVGRDDEETEVRDLLMSDEIRLLTLTGPGGIGKSRLAFEVADRCKASFKDGVAYALLAALNDAQLVGPAIARALDVKESAERSVSQNLKEYLRDKELLLILDTFEHVTGAAPLVSELLSACPRLKILVTSRALLFVRGERDYDVPPLVTPPADERARKAATEDTEAVVLFIQRAKVAHPDFDLTPENKEAIEEICWRLDGLPLAIELAAARTRHLTVQAMLARIRNRLELLTEGPEDLPERQRTLRAALDWDYELLNDIEQAIFRRLAVFAGGFELAAAEAVVQDGEFPLSYIVDTVESLTGKSLLSQLVLEGAEPRYTMLKTLREYAFSRLDEHDETVAVRERHTRYFLELAKQAAERLHEVDQVSWLELLDREHDNFRAALRTAAERHDHVTQLDLAGALAGFWEFRAHLSEGQRWLEAAINNASTEREDLRARCLEGAGRLARGQGEFKRAEAFLEEAIDINRRINDRTALAWSLKSLGIVAFERGNNARAAALYRESIELMREVGEKRGEAEGLNNLGVIASTNGDIDEAVSYYEQALDHLRSQGDKQAMARVLMNMGEAKMEQGEFGAAKGYIRGSLTLCREIESHWDIADLLELMASVQNGFGRVQEGAMLFGAASAIRELLGAPLPPVEKESYDQRVAEVKDALSEEEFSAAWKQGEALSIDEAVAFGLS